MDKDFTTLFDGLKNFQTKLNEAKKDMKNITVTGESGAGSIKITLQGNHYAKQ